MNPRKSTSSKPTARHWLSLHVHENADQDGLLRECVRPLVDALRAEGLVDRFFFIRYWLGGPHVRLRFAVAPDRAAPLSARIRRAVERHHAGTEAQDPDPAAYRREAGFLAPLEGLAPRADRLRPDHTVHEQRYEPEYGKYGGAAGVDIAEELFDISSRAALDALSVEPRTRRYTHALPAMLAGLRAAGYSGARLAAFLDRHRAVWSPYVSDGYRATWRGSAVQHLRQYASVIDAGLNADVAGTPWRDWALGLAGAVARARSRPEAPAQISAGAPGDPDADPVDHLVTHYLHTHLNRLGLLPSQEAYLAFLGAGSVRRRTVPR